MVVFTLGSGWCAPASNSNMKAPVASGVNGYIEGAKGMKNLLVFLSVLLIGSSLWAQSVPNNMVRINGGTFTMGSPANEEGRAAIEGHQRQVTVSGFSMGKYQVTQKEYQEIMGANPSGSKGDNHPVEMVSWFDAVQYCNRLSQKEGLTPAYSINGENVTWNRSANGYRLPTEAEWEYACRAGTTTAFNTGDSITAEQANFDDRFPYNFMTMRAHREGTTKPVGSFAPNAWGLYDMHGNVYEWCWDWFGAYANEAQTDSLGASSGHNRVMRGGYWSSRPAYNIRSAFRESYPPSSQTVDIGFRIVRS